MFLKIMEFNRDDVFETIQIATGGCYYLKSVIEYIPTTFNYIIQQIGWAAEFISDVILNVTPICMATLEVKTPKL